MRVLTSLNKDIMPFQCRCDNLTLVWSDVSSKQENKLAEGKHNNYLKLAFPKTLLKVKSGSTGDFLPVCLDMLKGNGHAISDTRSRLGHKSGKSFTHLRDQAQPRVPDR